MSSKDFVIDKIKKFLQSFKNVKGRYEYDELARLYTLKITSQSIYDSEAFDQWDSSMFDDFVENYPDENIGFISEDALVKIDNDNLIFEGKGSEFNKN